MDSTERFLDRNFYNDAARISKFGYNLVRYSAAFGIAVNMVSLTADAIFRKSISQDLVEAAKIGGFGIVGMVGFEMAEDFFENQSKQFDTGQQGSDTVE